MWLPTKWRNVRNKTPAHAAPRERQPCEWPPGQRRGQASGNRCRKSRPPDPASCLSQSSPARQRAEELDQRQQQQQELLKWQHTHPPLDTWGLTPAASAISSTTAGALSSLWGRSRRHDSLQQQQQQGTTYVTEVSQPVCNLWTTNMYPLPTDLVGGGPATVTRTAYWEADTQTGRPVADLPSTRLRIRQHDLPCTMPVVPHSAAAATV